MSLEILYRDERLVAVYKPAGLLVHRTDMDRGARDFLLQRLRDQIGQRLYPVHRLDKPTAGVIVFGLDSEAAGRMAVAFAERRVDKQYLAVVRGWTDAEGCIDRPLRSLDGRRGGGEPQEAVTEYRTLARSEMPWAIGRYDQARYSLVAVHPLTGRQHQIRRHFSHIAHPIIGDGAHGDRHHNRFFRDRFGRRRLMLLARRLRLPHPEDGRPLELVATPDEEFLSVCTTLGWTQALLALQNGADGPIQE